MVTLLLTENFPPAVGGTARWFWELYRRLPRSAVVIAAGACPGDRAFDQTHDLRVERLPLTFGDWGFLSIGGYRRHRRAARAVRALVRRESARQIHCGRLLPEGWLALCCRVPYSCFVHGEELNTIRTSRELMWMARRALRRTCWLVANARNTARVLQEEWGVTETKIRVLHPGVDARRFVPAAPDEEARRALGWSGRSVVLTVSRLQKRKGQDRMIDAVGMLRRHVPNVLYAIVGDGEEAERLKEYVRRLGLSQHVRFHGAVDEATLLRAYQQCDLFVLPNRTVAGDFEGFGMVLLEAQACGRPVVAGTSGGTAEAVRPEETGLIVDCARPDVLAAAVTGLLSDGQRREQMGRAARQWVERTFDFDALAPHAASLLGVDSGP